MLLGLSVLLFTDVAHESSRLPQELKVSIE